MTETVSNINSYLTFKLGDEFFATNVSKVLNILEMTKVTKVPKAPGYMKGVINLRGSVLPLVDTRIKFEMTETVYTPNTCILVLDILLNNESVHVGALVDSVQEVVEIDDKAIQPAPSIGTRYRTEFIEGVAKINEEFVMILNMDLIFSTEDLSILKESFAENKEEATV
jgi:purine-binding chemotaxis protein CheW